MPKRKPREGGDTAVATEKKTRTARPRLWRVLLHNDDFTTMEFVVKVLTEVFNKTPAEATDLMLQVHHRGACVAGSVPPRGGGDEGGGGGAAGTAGRISLPLYDGAGGLAAADRAALR